MNKIKEFIIKHKKTIIITLILFIAIALRLINFNSPFSHDEWYTYDIVARNFSSMNTQMYDDVHMPLYFYIAKIYTSIFELTKSNLKFISFIFGILGIIAFYIFTKKYFQEKIAILSTAILSFSLFHVSYSQTARMYSLLFLFTVISLYFLFEIIFENKKRSIIGYVISNLVVLYTHFFGFFFLLFETLTIYRFRDKIKDKKRTIYGQIILILLSLPFAIFMLIQIIRKINGTSYSAWMPPTTIEDIYIALGALSSNHILTPIFILILIVFIYKYLKNKYNETEKNKVLFWGTIICFILPAIITFMTPIFAWRYYFIFYPIFLIIISKEILIFIEKNNKFKIIILISVLSLLLLSSVVYLEKMNLSKINEETCIIELKEKISEYEKKNTYFVTYRWLNEWVPNHKPITEAHKEFQRQIGQETELINYYDTSIDYLFNNYTYVMAISPSGLNDYFISSNISKIKEKGECSEISTEKYFFYKYHYFIYALNNSK